MIRLGSASAGRIFVNIFKTYVMICIKNGGLYNTFWSDQYLHAHPIISTAPTIKRQKPADQLSTLYRFFIGTRGKSRLSTNSQRHPKMSVGNTIQYLNLTPNAVCTHASVTKRIIKVTQTQPAGVYPYGEKLR